MAIKHFSLIKCDDCGRTPDGKSEAGAYPSELLYGWVEVRLHRLDLLGFVMGHNEVDGFSLVLCDACRSKRFSKK